MFRINLDLHKVIAAFNRWRCKRGWHMWWNEPRDVRIVLQMESVEWRNRWFDQIADARLVKLCLRCHEPRDVTNEH